MAITLKSAPLQQKRRTFEPAFFFLRFIPLLIILVTTYVYSSALFNPFLATEVKGLLHSSVFTDLETTWSRMVTPKGLLHKPISMLSFALQFEYFGTSPFSFHLVNLSLHIVNTILVWRLAKSFAVAPCVAMLIFALHPLQTSGAALVFGRPYVLASMFLLCAILLCRSRPLGAGLLYAISTLTLLMVLSKQTFIVAPLLLAWLMYDSSDFDIKEFILNIWDRYYYISVAGICGILLVIFGYAIPYSETAIVSPGVFFKSQLGNFLTVMWSQFLVPYRTALLHTLPWYQSFLDSSVLTGAVVIVLLIAVSCIFRAFLPARLLGAFLIMLLPTNSVFPKDQVVVEWRFYPAMIFFSLLFACYIQVLLNSSRKAVRFVTHSTLALLLFSYVLFTSAQIKAYSTVERAYLDVLSLYPNSLFALNDLGNHYLRSGDLENAEIFLARAQAVAPRSRKVASNLKFLEAIKLEARQIKRKYVANHTTAE